jgi:hypothetical protein
MRSCAPAQSLRCGICKHGLYKEQPENIKR